MLHFFVHLSALFLGYGAQKQRYTAVVVPRQSSIFLAIFDPPPKPQATSMLQKPANYDKRTVTTQSLETIRKKKPRSVKRHSISVWPVSSLTTVYRRKGILRTRRLPMYDRCSQDAHNRELYAPPNYRLRQNKRNGQPPVSSPFDDEYQ